MKKKKLYLSHHLSHLGKSEVWAINELNSLIELGNEIFIVPRTGKGK